MSERPRPCKRKVVAETKRKVGAEDPTAEVGAAVADIVADEIGDAVVAGDGAAAGTNTAAVVTPGAGTTARPCKRRGKTAANKVVEEPAAIGAQPNNSSNGSTGENNDSELEDVEEVEEVGGVSANPPLYDPSMPHLLRIGEDGAAEMIELAKQKFLSGGSFNTHGFGSGIRELENLYGVRTQAQIAAMQRAFGVKTMLEQPPLTKYLQQSCKFEGFDMVLLALRTRARNLMQALTVDSKSQKALRNKHNLTWLTKTIKEMDGVGRDCTAENLEAIKPKKKAALKKKNSGSGFLAGLFAPRPAGTDKTCLEDAGLLRDLIYLVAMLHGIANPEVKKQLEQVPLQNILDLAAKQNVKGARDKLQIALEALRGALGGRIAMEDKGCAGSAECDEQYDALLEEIYHMFHGADAEIPIGLSADAVLEMIALEIQRRAALLEDIDRMFELEARIAELEEASAGKNKDFAASEERGRTLAGVITRLQGSVITLEEAVATARAEKENAERQLRECEEGRTAASAERATEAAAAATAATQAGTRITELEGLLNEAQAALAQVQGEKADVQKGFDAEKALLFKLRTKTNALKARVAAQDEQIQRLNAELAEAREALATGEEAGGQLAQDLTDKEAKLAAKEAENTALKATLESLRALYGNLQDEMEGLREGTNAAQRTFTGQLNALRAEKEAAEARVAELTGQVAGHQEQLEDLQRRVAEAHTAVNASREEKNLTSRAIAEANARINELEANLRTAQEKLTAKEAELTAASDALAAKEAALTTAQTALEGKDTELEILRAELAALRTSTDAEHERLARESASAGAAQEARIAELTAQLTAAQRNVKAARKNLEENNEEHAAALMANNKRIAELEQTLVTAKTQAASIQADLDAATANLDAEKARLTDDYNTLKKVATKGISQLKNKIAELKSLLATQNQAITENDAELASLRAANRTLQEQLDAATRDCETRMGELQTQLTAAEGRLAEAQTGALTAANAAGAVQTEQTEQIRAQKREIQALKAEIEVLNKRLRSLTASKISKSVLLSARQTEMNSKDATIRRLEAELEAARAAAGVSAAKNTQIATLEEELAAARRDADTARANAAAAREGANSAAAGAAAQIQRLSGELEAARQNTAAARQNAAAARGNAEGAAAQIAELQQQLAAAETRAGNTTTKNTEIAGLKQQLADAEAAKRVLQGQLTGQLDIMHAQAKQIKELEDAAAAQAAQFAAARQAQAAELTGFEERVGRLLGAILLDSEMLVQAQAYLEGDDDNLAVLQNEMCDYFTYMYNTLSIQIARIGGSQSVLSEEEKYDIFTLFSGLPAFKPSDVIQEFTKLFQEIFNTFSAHRSIRAVDLQGEYPVLYSLFGPAGYRIDAGSALTGVAQMSRRAGIASELMNNTFFNGFGLVPGAKNTFSIQKGKELNFHGNNTNHFTFLSVFVIKYIQLLYVKFAALMDGKCGIRRVRDMGGAAAADGGRADEEEENNGAAAAGGGGGDVTSVKSFDTPMTIEEEVQHEEEKAELALKRSTLRRADVQSQIPRFIVFINKPLVGTLLPKKAYYLKYLEGLRKIAEESFPEVLRQTSTTYTGTLGNLVNRILAEGKDKLQKEIAAQKIKNSTADAKVAFAPSQVSNAARRAALGRRAASPLKAR